MYSWSAVIPCYNAESFVERSLNSILTQTVTVERVAVVIDQCEDETEQVVKSWATKNSEIDLVILHTGGERTGACAARNMGLDSIDSTWVQFLDADDRLQPDKVETQLQLASSGSDVIVDSFVVHQVDGSTRNSKCANGILTGFFNSRLGTTSSLLFKTKAAVSAGGWDEKAPFSQEYVLMRRLLLAGASFEVLDTRKTDYILRSDGQLSKGNNPERTAFVAQFICESLNALRPLMDDKEQHFAKNAVIDKIRWLHRVDRESALKLHSAYIPLGFRPTPWKHHSRMWCLLYRLVGFDRCEWL